MDSTWDDDTVTAGKAYEYKVERFLPTGIGFIYAGIDLPLGDDDSTIQSPGTVILVIDETQIDAMQPDDVIAEIDRLKLDLLAEGWKVEVVDDVNPNDTPADVRKKIFDIYDVDKTNVKAVFLIGHIPVPMSGSSSPDGHVPSRPMPADVFYGDMDSDAMGVSLWDLDGSGNLNENTVPADPVGGVDNDGKPVELMVGRVDMRDLPAFSDYDDDLDETELLRRYLDKDHAFRTGQVAVTREGRIRDNMSRSESSPGAWQTLSGFFGPAAAPTAANPDNIDVNKWTDTTWPLAMGLSSIVSGDFTGDPNVDSSVEIVTASADDNRIAWYDRDSQGNLEMHVVSDKVRHVSSVLLADLDGDGNDDILSASLIVNASAGTTSSGAWGTLSGLFGQAENPTPTEPDHINVWQWEDTDWARRVTLPPGRMCGRPRWTTLSLAL